MAQATAQYLNWTDFVAPNVLGTWDGGYIRFHKYAGPDCTHREHDVLFREATQLGNVLRWLKNGYMLETHRIRRPVTVPFAKHHCADSVSAMIYEERAEKYRTIGEHYANRDVLSLTYLPPNTVEQQVGNLFFEGGEVGRLPSREVLLQKFIEDSDEFYKALSGGLALKEMNETEIGHFLNLCTSSEDLGIGLSPDRTKVNYAAGAVEIAPHEGRVGGKLHTRIISIVGWPGDGTIPQMFEQVSQLSMSLRMQHRFIAMSPQEAVKVLTNKLKDWNQLNTWNPKWFLRAFTKKMTPVSISPSNQEVIDYNTDAEAQMASVKREIERVLSGEVRLGWYAMSIVLQEPSRAKLEMNAGLVVNEIQRLGFKVIVETDNAADALFSTFPGHGSYNLRNYEVNTQHLARLLPTSSLSIGEPRATNPFYPEGSGPLLTVTGLGNTPISLNLHKGSLGNFIFCGPAGAGKTYGLGSICFGFRQYPNAQINVFERDAGGLPANQCALGSYYDARAVEYAPLAYVDQEEDIPWAERFVTTLAELCNFPMTAQGRKDLRKALRRLGESRPEYRTISNYHAQLQTGETGLKEAIGFYVGSILDGVPGPEQQSSWESWDMLNLLGLGEVISTPALMHLFHKIQRRLDGRPTLTIFEEAWQNLVHEWLETYTEESSANYRKQVNAMGLVLHSPANLADFKRRQLLMANIATMIFCPNSGANTTGENGQKPHYESMGLSNREIRLIAEELPPYHYYFVQDKERFVFQFNNGPLAHAILSKNGRDHKDRILSLRKEYQDLWVPVWLREQGHHELVDRYYPQREAA